MGPLGDDCRESTADTAASTRRPSTGNLLVHAKHAVIDVGGVDGKLERAGIVDVGGRRRCRARRGCNDEHRACGASRNEFMRESPGLDRSCGGVNRCRSRGIFAFPRRAVSVPIGTCAWPAIADLRHEPPESRAHALESGFGTSHFVSVRIASAIRPFRIPRPRRQETMLYHLHELNRTLLNPLVAWSGAAARALSAPDNWMSRMPGMDRVAAGYELLVPARQGLRETGVQHHVGRRARARGAGRRSSA